MRHDIGTGLSNLDANRRYVKNIGDHYKFQQTSKSQRAGLAQSIDGSIKNSPKPNGGWQKTHWINGESKPPEFEFRERLDRVSAPKLLTLFTLLSTARIGMDPNAMLPERVPLAGGGLSYGGASEQESSSEQAKRNPSDNVIILGEGTPSNSAASSQSADLSSEEARPNAFDTLTKLYEPISSVVSDFMDERAGGQENSATAEAGGAHPRNRRSVHGSSSEQAERNPSDDIFVEEKGTPSNSADLPQGTGLNSAKARHQMFDIFHEPIPSLVLASEGEREGGQGNGAAAEAGGAHPRRRPVDNQATENRRSVDSEALGPHISSTEQQTPSEFVQARLPVISPRHRHWPTDLVERLARYSNHRGSQAHKVVDTLENLHAEYLRQSGSDHPPKVDGNADSFLQFCADVFDVPLSGGTPAEKIRHQWTKPRDDQRLTTKELVSDFQKARHAVPDSHNSAIVQTVLRHAFDQAVQEIFPLGNATDAATNHRVHLGTEQYLDAVKGVRLAGSGRLDISGYALYGQQWRSLVLESGDQDAINRMVRERALDFAASKGHLVIDTPENINNAVEYYINHLQNEEVKHANFIKTRLLAPLQAKLDGLTLDSVLKSVAGEHGVDPNQRINAWVVYSIFERNPDESNPACEGDPNIQFCPPPRRSDERVTTRSLKQHFTSGRIIDHIEISRSDGSKVRISPQEVQREFADRLRNYESSIRSTLPRIALEFAEKAMHSRGVTSENYYYPVVKDGNPASRKAMVHHVKDEVGKDGFVAVSLHNGFPVGGHLIGSTLAEAKAYVKQHPEEFDSSIPFSLGTNGSPVVNARSDPRLREEFSRSLFDGDAASGDPLEDGADMDMLSATGIKARIDARRDLFERRINTSSAKLYEEFALPTLPGYGVYECFKTIDDMRRQNNNVTEAPNPALPDDPSLYDSNANGTRIDGVDVANACIGGFSQTIGALMGKVMNLAGRHASRNVVPKLPTRDIAQSNVPSARQEPVVQEVLDRVAPGTSGHRSATKQAMAFDVVKPSDLQERLRGHGGRGAHVSDRVFGDSRKTAQLDKQVDAANLLRAARYDEAKFNSIGVDSSGHGRVWDVSVSENGKTKHVQMLVHNGVLHTLDTSEQGQPKMKPATEREQHAFKQDGARASGSISTLTDVDGKSKVVIKTNRGLYEVDDNENGDSRLRKAGANDHAVFSLCARNTARPQVLGMFLANTGASAGNCGSITSSSGNGGEQSNARAPRVDVSVTEEYYRGGSWESIRAKVEAAVADIKQYNDGKRLNLNRDVYELSNQLEKVLRAGPNPPQASVDKLIKDLGKTAGKLNNKLQAQNVPPVEPSIGKKRAADTRDADEAGPSGTSKKRADARDADEAGPLRQAPRAGASTPPRLLEITPAADPNGDPPHVPRRGGNNNWSKAHAVTRTASSYVFTVDAARKPYPERRRQWHGQGGGSNCSFPRCLAATWTWINTETTPPRGEERRWCRKSERKAAIGTVSARMRCAGWARLKRGPRATSPIRSIYLQRS